MPPVIGILFTLGGIWFLFQAFKRRRYLLSLRTDREQDTEAGSALAESNPAPNRPRSNSSLQQFASGCAPVVAMGMLLLTLAMAAIALLMDGPRRLSIFDILGLLFFTAAYTFSLLVQTFYSVTTQSDKPPKPADDSDG